MIKGFFAKTKDNKTFFIKALNKSCYLFNGVYHLKDEIKKEYKIEEFDFFSSNTKEIELVENNKIFANALINLVDREVNLKSIDLEYEDDMYEFHFIDKESNINIYAYFKIDQAYKEIAKIKKSKITLLKENKTFSFNDLEKFGGDEGVYIIEQLKGFLEDAVLYYDFVNQVIEEEEIVEILNRYSSYNYLNFERFFKRIKKIFEITKETIIDEVA